MEISDCEILVVDGSGNRDGLGIEVWHNNELVIEILRNDYKKSREITLYKKDAPLDLIEKTIDIFKEKIPEGFDNK